MARIGTLYGVGVGPGDPELITLKARRILSEVSIIFVPKKGRESSSYARAIISGYLRPGQEVIELVFPMVREAGKLQQSWDVAADSVWQHLASGRDCALVNLGDPLLYGTFIPLAETLKRHHPDVKMTVIPGVSSMTSAAADALVPLARGDDKVAIISGHCHESVIRQAIDTFDTVVFMKVNGCFDRLVGMLEGAGAASKCVYVSRSATAETEVVTDISSLRGRKLDYFSLVIYRR